MEMNRENYDELFRADPKTVQTQPAQSPKSREEWAACGRMERAKCRRVRWAACSPNKTVEKVNKQ